MELEVPESVIKEVIDYVHPNVERFAKRGFFDGSENQKIIGRIGFLMAKRIFKMSEIDDKVDGEPDKYDFRLDGNSYDIKTSYSYIYRQTGKPPDDWGIIIPQTQFNFKQHDYYIRCVLDGENPEKIRKCYFLCACDLESVKKSPIIHYGYPVPMRVVTPSMTFNVEKLLYIGKQLELFDKYSLQRYTKYSTRNV